MWIISVSLIMGIIIGLSKLLPEKIIKNNSKFQQAGVVLLIFSMGASIGADKELLKSLSAIGLKAFVFAFLACLLSTSALFFLSKKFIRGAEKE
ncbi:hypothetical protein OXPF_06850 [Oxobacter pfennigii]|uniref:DUF340 domain-containing protein n=1 Tax=Oxobacter pfennigii TaxID=36849 RepID=A0A0P8WC17_9CLOT|nr:LysO family transporter [Oxobacter pfennigii]KPU45452.1 hypothetical protein OXPF_06850 [Oxobacter pfennigii]